ncbi:hypothetical protein R3P38DRAFT_3215881 [Favolaschia claudopus]|uniref:Uncharacterized protein n=1 Tax=Favolaschia claudopus TaxID=2862362 RepID=A0AAW0A897_9AGAR
MSTFAIHLPFPVCAEQPHTPVTTSLHLRFLYKLSRLTGVAIDPSLSGDWEANTRNAVFVALGSDGAEVVVKFARRYNVQAHELLAKSRLAPKLLHHRLVRGGMTMVVMERVVGTFDKQSKFYTVAASFSGISASPISWSNPKMVKSARY